MGTDSLKSARQIRNPTSNADINDAFDGITYSKGGHVLSMFESISARRVSKSIRLHMKRFEDDAANVDDFMQSLAEGSGDDAVVESFRSFIFQPGIPYLNVEATCKEDETGLITVTQQRYAPLGSDINVDGQTWQVPFAMRVSGPDGEEVVREMLTGKTTNFRLRQAAPTGSCRMRPAATGASIPPMRTGTP